ncbi:arsenite methyltransferase [Chloroflexota bacterium]
MEDKQIRKVVRENYAKVAKQERSCCGSSGSCCGGSRTKQDISRQIGYTGGELTTIPEEANLGLGCGNPVALASLKTGETVLDLGSGAGIDCFLAANRVGKTGRVIGVDMTPEMLEKARGIARDEGYTNVEFRLGEIENLPVADNLVDVIVSNCVINLSPDKEQVFREAFRALKPGGRLMVSDIILLRELPDFIKDSIEAYIGCLSGASLKTDYLAAIGTTGFEEVNILSETIFPLDLITSDTAIQTIIKDLVIPQTAVAEIAGSVVSAQVTAVKPA